MYNVSSVSLQNIYAPSAATKSSSKKDDSAAIDTAYAPSAAEKYAETGSSAVSADNLYDILAERAKTSAEKLAKFDFSDMYVKSTAHQYVLSETQRNALRRGDAEYGDMFRKRTIIENTVTKETECICVPIGPGELPQFMDDIMQALSDGVSLTDALINKAEEWKTKNHKDGYGTPWTDLFYINPANGDVVVSNAKGRIHKSGEYEGVFSDADAALELADDLTTFLRYAAFVQEDDDPERVEALFSYIKDKQAFANYDRYIFDSDLDESVDNDAMANLIIANLTAAGVLKGEDDEEEEEEAIDMLMEAVKEHQETLREDMIDREKSELAIKEINEILDSRVESEAKQYA